MIKMFRILSCILVLSASVVLPVNASDDVTTKKDEGLNHTVKNSSRMAFPEDEKGYIRNYSFYQGDDKELVSEGLALYEQQLADFNNQNDIKVYVLLLNGIAFGQTNHVIPQNASVRDVLAWSDKDKFNTFPMDETVKEVSAITDQIGKKVFSDVKKAIICALVEFDVQYGFNQAKRFTYYHSIDFGIENNEGADFRTSIEALIKGVTFSDDQKVNLSKLVSSIRTAGQERLIFRSLKDYKELESYLLGIHEPLRMTSVIKMIDTKSFLNFSHPLRAHVIRVLMKEYSQQGAPHYMPPQQVDYPETVLTLLDQISDAQIKSWHEYMRTPQNNRILLGEIINNFYDKPFGKANYQLLMKLFAKQLTLNADYLAEVDKLAEKDVFHKNIVWSESYALKLFTTPPIGTTKYDVELSNDGMIKFTLQYVERWDKTLFVEYADWSESKGPYTLHPFEPVQFLNRSKLSMLRKGERSDLTYEVVPAIYLLYAKQKEFNDNVGTGIEMGADIATLVFPLTKIRYLGKLGQRVVYGVEVADKINSFLRLSANLGVGGTEFAEIATIYNESKVAEYVSYAGLSITTADAVTNLGKFVKAVNTKKEALQNATQTPEVEYVLKLSEQIDAEASILLGKGWLDGISDVTSLTDKKLFESITNKVRNKSSLSREEIAFLRSKNFPQEYIDEVVPDIEAGCQLECAIGKYGCFAPATLVSAETGQIAIRNVKEGMNVWSYNHSVKKKELKKVTGLKKYVAGSLLALGLSNGAEVQATDNHPFYARGEYRSAKELVVGDTLQRFDAGKTLVITSLRVIENSDSVYNFTVADNGNYYVGRDGVLVHNTCLAQTLAKEQFKKLHDKLNLLDDDLRKQFFNDFVNATETELKVLNDNLGRIDAWTAISKHAELRTNSEFLDNIALFSDDLLKQLDVDLLNAKYKLIEFFKETPSDVTRIWKELKDDPALAWEKSKTDPEWKKWNDREFFMSSTAKGKKFETDACLEKFKKKTSLEYEMLKAKVSEDLGKNLDEYDLFSQLQLIYDGGKNYFIADQAFVLYRMKDNEKVVDDIIVIEDKLKESTGATSNQKGAFTATSYTVRSLNATSESGKNTLAKDTVIPLSNTKQWYKAYDSENGEVIKGIDRIDKMK